MRLAGLRLDWPRLGGRPAAVATLLCVLSAAAVGQQHFHGDKALAITRDFVAIGPRWITSPGHAKAEAFLRAQFKQDQLEEDAFTANTPIGVLPMRNFIVRFKGSKDGVIMLTTHYETNYFLKDIHFVGANDGGSTTGMLIEIANELRAKTAGGRKLDGYSVWLVFFDGEEAIVDWRKDNDHTYGSRHLAAKWGQDGTLPKIKALLLADMLGDKDLDVERESQSTGWLADTVAQAAKLTGNAQYFFKTVGEVDDDHVAFLKRGVPSVDVIDINYGPHNLELPDGFHHTADDTMDKISAHSLTVAGDVFLETIELVNKR